MFNFPARAYNEVMFTLRRSKPLPGVGTRIRETSAGVVVSGSAPNAKWNHPWSLHPKWSGGKWRVWITPGFVNGANVSVNVLDEKGKRVERFLTDDPMPEVIVDSWRNPLAMTFSDSGAPIAGSYPPFFKRLGVKKPDQVDPTVAAILGGSETGATINVPLFDDSNQYGTRRLMSSDIVISSDHAAIKTDTVFADPTTGNVAYQVPAFSFPPNRWPHRVFVQAEYTPPKYPTMLDKLMGQLDEPTFDTLHIARLWMVSPPDEPDETVPNETWTAYPQHKVFWNVAYTSVNHLDFTRAQPITIHTGLAFGLLDSIGNSMLAPINNAMQAAYNALNDASTRGYFWTV